MTRPVPARTRPARRGPRSWLVAPLVLIVALALGACTSLGGGGAGSGSSTLVFGAPISLTGSTAKEGGLTRDGYDIWRDTYNKAGGINVGGKHYKIETKYYDDESNAQKSATLAEKLIKEDKVNFLLGPYGTSPTLQVSTVAEKNKIPMIEGNGAAESIFSQGYKYTFGVLSPAQNYLRGVVDMALTPRTRSRPRSPCSPPTTRSRSRWPTRPRSTPSRRACRSSTTRSTRTRRPTCARR